jgi:hypothetical protein
LSTIQVATYQAVSERVRFGPPFGSFGSPSIRLTAQGGINTSSPLVAILYDGNPVVGNLSTDGLQLTVHYPRSSYLAHLQTLQTERPVFFDWVIDPAGEVAGISLRTGEEPIGEGLADTS